MFIQIWEDEWKDIWPEAFWDDWVRHPDRRKNRQCIRPEIPRTSTFGKIGVSNGQFFDQHLAKIHELHQWIDWSNFDIDSLRFDRFDREFLEKIERLPKLRTSQISKINQNSDLIDRSKNACVVIYNSKTEFLSAARSLQIMSDFKAGVPRMGYRGVVITLYNGVQVYLSPAEPRSWHYHEDW